MYNADNIERVRRDEEVARKKEEEEEFRMQQEDAERRIMELRKRALERQQPREAGGGGGGGGWEVVPGGAADKGSNKRAASDDDNDAMVMLGMASRGLSRFQRKRVHREEQHGAGDRDSSYATVYRKADDDKTSITRGGGSSGGTSVVSLSKLEGAGYRERSSIDPQVHRSLTDKSGHINLFSEGPSGPRKLASRDKNPEYEKEKSEKEAKIAEQFNMALGKPAEELRPWYTTVDKMGEKQERKTEKQVEREQRRDQRFKDLNDPMAAMRRGVKQLKEVEYVRQKEHEERRREIEILKQEQEELEAFSLDGPSRTPNRELRRHRDVSQSDARRGRRRHDKPRSRSRDSERKREKHRRLRSRDDSRERERLKSSRGNRSSRGNLSRDKEGEDEHRGRNKSEKSRTRDHQQGRGNKDWGYDDHKKEYQRRHGSRYPTNKQDMC